MAGDIRLPGLAWRNLWRNTRRTLITVFGIVFGVFLAVVFTGLADATYGDMIEYAAKVGVGHVSVEHEDYRETPSLDHSVTLTPAQRAAIEGHPAVRRAVPRVQGQALIATAQGSVGVGFLAVDPAAEDPSTLMILESITQGRALESPDEAGIVLGAVLADNLGVKLGKKVVVTTSDPRGEIVSILVRVRGLIRTGYPTVDGSMAILPLGLMRARLQFEANEATSYAVFLDDHRDAVRVAAALQRDLTGSARAMDWSRAQPDLAAFIDMKRGGGNILQGIIMMLIAAGIFNTLLVAVMERRREFGVLRALGFSPRQLFGLITLESLWLSLVGLVAAAAITYFPYQYLKRHGIDYSAVLPAGSEVSGVALDPIMRVEITSLHLVVIACIVVAATVLPALYPAWRASRTEPVDAISQR